MEVPLYLYGFYKGVHPSPPGTGTQRNFCLFHFGEKSMAVSCTLINKDATVRVATKSDFYN